MSEMSILPLDRLPDDAITILQFGSDQAASHTWVPIEIFTQGDSECVENSSNLRETKLRAAEQLAQTGLAIHVVLLTK